jgi:chemotaxis protein methyltransferase CheR
MSDLPLSAPVFAILSALIEERAGLSYKIDDTALLAEKLSARALELGFDSLLDYYYFLRYDPGNEQELELLLNSLVVNETFFFRELPQLEFVASHVLAPLARAGHRPRVWSAACSTGEEPLTLAMLLDEQGVLDQVEIVATDISGTALARARSGRHGRRSLRQSTKPALVAKWLEVRDDRVAVQPALTAAVRWQRLNLLDEEAVRALGRFECILCRNVLIYFKDATTVRVVTQLSKQLTQEGLLVVGVSESLMRFGTALVCEERSGVFVYRRAGE